MQAAIFRMRVVGVVLWVLSWPALAQAQGLLRGQVLDAETSQPIPNAQVSVAGNRIGTMTNEDGRFALSVPAQYQREALDISMLGYAKYTQALPGLPGPELRIMLRPSPAVLGEVQVTASVVGIVREAVARIPRNYPTRPTQLTGFYRESDNDEAGQPRYMVEGLLTVFKAPYQERTDNGDVQIKQSRKVDLRSDKQLVRVDWAGGPFIAHRGDFVHLRAQFIDPGQFRHYNYRLAPGSTYQGRPVYVVTFAPKDGDRRADFEGRMYIEQDSYAFLGAEWSYTAAGLSRSPEPTDSRRLRVAYQPYAGRWYLKSVWWQTKARLPVGPRLNYFGEFLTTAIDTAQAAPPSYVERAQYHDVFLRNAVAYDSAFWQGQTTLLPSENLRRALLDQRRQQRADSLFKAAPEGTSAPQPEAPQKPEASRLEKFFTRFRYGAAVGNWPLTATAARVALAYAPTGYGFRLEAADDVAQPAFTALTKFEYQFELTRELAVRLATQSVYRQFRGEGWDAGLSYQHNLNPRHRPVFGRAGLAYTRQAVGRPLGTFRNPDAGLRVAGTKLSADELGGEVQSVTDSLQPSLGVGLELSHKFELVADAGYLVALRHKTQLQLHEESGFFLGRSTAVLDLPHPDAQLLVNGEPTDAVPWQTDRFLLSFGLLYRLR